MPTSAKALPWELSDELWTRIEPLLPKVRPKTRGRGRARRKVGGRPRVSDRTVLAGILYVLRTGCQWQAVPRQYGSSSTVHPASSSGSGPESSGACGGPVSPSTTTWRGSPGAGKRSMGP